METNRTEQAESQNVDQYSALQLAIARITDQVNKLTTKNPDDLAEDFIKDNKVPRPLDFRIEIANPLTPQNLDQINLSYIEALPDGPGKDQAYFLFNLVQKSIFAIQQAEHAAKQWRSKADGFLVMMIKEMWVKKISRETQGNLGRL